MVSQYEVIAQARDWIGVPFAHQGRSRSGVDCLGLLVMVAQGLALNFQCRPVRDCDDVTYGHRPDTVQLRAGLCAYLEPLSITAMQPADIVLMRVEHVPQHLAIVSDYPEPGQRGMIHAYAPARKVVEHRLCERWSSAIEAVFRLPQLSS